MSKRDETKLKQEVRILKRECAELKRTAEQKNENSAEMNKRLRRELRACQDSQRQLAENCKHYRKRLADSTDTCTELRDRLYLAERARDTYFNELKDSELEVKELQVDKAELRASLNTMVVCTGAVVVIYAVTEGLRFFGVL